MLNEIWIIPSEVIYIIKTLQDNNFEAYIVGGCVRDSLLGRTPKDWDITTNALPEDIQKLFNHTIPTGIKHGTITVIVDNSSFEITTFRTDGDYLDNRRPSSVKFTSKLEEDLSRRDFTINAMAYNSQSGIVDLFNGQKHLEEKNIKCVGSPNKRFQEDALRMLRAIRFATQFQFSIYKTTLESIKQNKELIKNISQERIRDELCKILMSDTPSFGLRMLCESGLLEIILPELYRCVNFDQCNKHHNKNVFEHILKVVDSIPNNLILRLSALLHDIGKPETFSLDEQGNGHFYQHHMRSMDIAENILKRLKFDNETIKRVCVLVKEHMSRFEHLKSTNIKKFINRVGLDNLGLLFELQIADIKGSRPPHCFNEIYALREECQRIIKEKQPLTIKDLVINGHDLMNLGYKEGKELGIILNKLLELVIENPSINTKDQLLKRI